MDPANFGKAIRTKRKASHLTQAELAGYCGVGTRFISEIERGKETVELGKALKVAKALGIEVSMTER